VRRRQFFGNWGGYAHGVGVHADRGRDSEVITHPDREAVIVNSDPDGHRR
jgi:hypothetical protein